MLSTQVKTYDNYINGQWVKSDTNKTFQSLNPANKEEVVGNFQSTSSEEAVRAIEAAAKAFPAWSSLSTSKRATLLNKAADLLESRLNEIAEELTREEGKPYKASLGEVKRSADTLRFYAVEGQTYTGETFPSDDPKMRVYTEKEPLGVISVITPGIFRSQFLHGKSLRHSLQEIRLYLNLHLIHR